MNEALNILQQEKLLDNILEDVDPTPHPQFGMRDFDKHEPIFKSVTKPGAKTTPEEEKLVWERYIDRNCDQVRLMIKRFTRGGEWTVDQFRLALGGIARPQLSTFLEKRGPSEGSTSRVFELSWEFFKKRELLGLPVPLVETNSASVNAQKDAADRGTKRHIDGDGDDPNKRPKVIEID